MGQRVRPGTRRSAGNEHPRTSRRRIELRRGIEHEGREHDTFRRARFAKETGCRGHDESGEFTGGSRNRPWPYSRGAHPEPHVDPEPVQVGLEFIDEAMHAASDTGYGTTRALCAQLAHSVRKRPAPA